MSHPWITEFEHARRQNLHEDQLLFQRHDPVERAYLVKSGRIFLRRALQDGGLLTLHVAGPGDLVAEASLFADRYHCDAVAGAETSVAVLPRRTLLAAYTQSDPETHPALTAFERTARDLQSLRTRVEVMRLRRVSDRLDAYLELHGPPPIGQWVRVADWIGVTPPALYRELAKRKKP